MKIIVVFFSCFLLMVLTGCMSGSVLEKIDPATGKVYERLTLNESAIKSVTEDLKGKSTIIWDTGWLGGIRLTTVPSPDNPNAMSFEALAGKQHKGLITLKPGEGDKINWEGIAKVIAATDNSNVSVGPNGIGESSKELKTSSGKSTKGALVIAPPKK